MILVPWQDINLPEGPPNEQDIADAGQNVINWLLLFPTVLVALIVTAVLYHLWKNNSAFRVMVMVIIAVVVTIMVVNAV